MTDGPAPLEGLADYRAVLLDLDGTLYLTGEPLPGAAAFVAACRAAGARVGFATNTSYVTGEACVERLARAGIPATVDEVLAAPASMALALTRAGVAEVACIGGSGLRAAIAEAGIGIVEVDQADPAWQAQGGRRRALAIGMDAAVTMATLHRAAELVEGGAEVYATTLEPHFPVAGGRQPGTGPIIAAMRAMAEFEPVVCGKPSERFAALASDWVGGRAPVLVVGDNLGTDIALAERLGWDSLLVMTGSTRPRDLGGQGPQPTFVAPDLATALGDAG